MEVFSPPPFCVGPSRLNLAFVPITFHSLPDGALRGAGTIFSGAHCIPIECRHMIKMVAGLDDEHFTEAKILQFNLTSPYWYL